MQDNTKPDPQDNKPEKPDPLAWLDSEYLADDTDDRKEAAQLPTTSPSDDDLNDTDPLAWLDTPDGDTTLTETGPLSMPEDNQEGTSLSITDLLSGIDEDELEYEADTDDLFYIDDDEDKPDWRPRNDTPFGQRSKSTLPQTGALFSSDDDEDDDDLDFGDLFSDDDDEDKPDWRPRNDTPFGQRSKSTLPQTGALFSSDDDEDDDDEPDWLFKLDSSTLNTPAKPDIDIEMPTFDWLELVETEEGNLHPDEQTHQPASEANTSPIAEAAHADENDVSGNDLEFEEEPEDEITAIDDAIAEETAQIRALRQKTGLRMSLERFLRKYGTYDTGWHDIGKDIALLLLQDDGAPAQGVPADFAAQEDHELLWMYDEADLALLASTDAAPQEDDTTHPRQHMLDALRQPFPFIKRYAAWVARSIEERRSTAMLDQRLRQFEALELPPDVDINEEIYQYASDILPRYVVRKLLEVRTNATGRRKIRACLSRLSEVGASEENKQQALDDLADTLNEDGLIPEYQRREIFQMIHNEMFGYGLLEPLLNANYISTIYINGYYDILVGSHRGQINRSYPVFDSEEHLTRIVNRLTAEIGVVDEQNPFLNGSLNDNTRIHVIAHPVSLAGTIVMIERSRFDIITVYDLIRFGTITMEIAEFLRACVVANLNILIIGGPNAGRTVLMEVLSSFIPDMKRVVSMDRKGEVYAQQDHFIPLRTHKSADGENDITIADLIPRALEIGAERLLINELQGEETLQLLRSMQQSDVGVMAITNATSAPDALFRLETQCSLAENMLSQQQIRQLIAHNFDVIVNIQRFADGSRKIASVTEVAAIEGSVIRTEDIFLFEQTGIEGGKIIGRIRPTGVVPGFLDRIKEAGIHLPPRVFGSGNTRR